MKSSRSIFTVILFLFLSKTSFAQQVSYTLPKFSPAKLRDDVLLLQKILEANHPSLYWYTTKDSLDACFANTIAGITDSLDEVAFKNKVAHLLSRVRCGHTSVRFSKSYSKNAARFRFPMFPLSLKAWNDSLVVISSTKPNDPVFKRGTIVTGIDGMSPRFVMDTLFRYISTDGFADNYKSQVVSGNFPAWYKTVMGIDSTYTISYIDSTGREATTQLKSFSLPVDLSPKNAAAIPAVQKPTRKQLRKAGLLEKRSLTIDTANSTAFIRLTTFSGGNLRGFFRKSFQTLKDLNIQNLVIDLRENGGGKVRSSILLAKYLSDHPFKVGDSVVAISRKFEYARYIKPVFQYWLAMHLGAKKMDDGLIHMRHYENHMFSPRKKNHFNGNIYILQGGYTFSAATMFISNLQGQKNVITIGEETGGGYYGNSAMHIPTITLPYSKLQVSMPMYRLVMDFTRKKGRGFIPDITVGPSSYAIKRGIDLKVLKVWELIHQKKTIAGK